jgi:uncharacterized protein YkwD
VKSYEYWLQTASAAANHGGRVIKQAWQLMSASIARQVSHGLGRWFVLLSAITLFLLPGIVAAQEDPKALFVKLINTARQREGLAPYDTSTLLNQAAQRHADDLVVLGVATQQGSDGTVPRQRILETRYHAWDDGLLVNELNWLGLGTVLDAVNWFRSDPDAWRISTDPLYREIGIGYVEANGIRYLVVTLGSRPGVLPIFINDGAEITESPSVAIRLTNEDAVPLGEGAWIGKAIEVRLSNTPDFEGEIWQSWEPLLPWTLASTEPGDYAVYVEYRDGAGRTTIAEDTILLVAPGEAPRATPIILPDIPRPVTTDEPESTSELASDETPAVLPEDTVLAETPLSPSATRQTPESTSLAATAPFVSTTPKPTWTPLNLETPVIEETKPQDWPLIITLALQGAAVLLGIVAFLKRR